MKRYSVNLDIDKKFYHPEIDLHHRALCFFANEFSGECENLRFYNNGITIENGEYGVFVSDEISCGAFDVMTASWNARTFGGSVRISASVDGEAWFTWGVWSSKLGVSASQSSVDKGGKMETDILTFDEKHTSFRFKIEITKGESSPVLYSVCFAINTENGALPKTESLSAQVKIPVRIQATVPEIGGRICSPTSVSMALDHLDHFISMQDTAAAVFDNGDNIYGNWSFNTSFPGELGFHSFLDFYDADALKYTLSQGIPVACSIKIKEGMLSKSGYPDRKTNGHLLLVTGFITKNGDDWLYINDPAVPSGKITVLLSEFMDIWRYGAAYIIQNKPERYVTYLSHGTADEMPVIADIVDKTHVNRRFERGEVGAKYIVIHNTDNWRDGAGAKAHSVYLKNFKQGDRPLGWHYTVDDEAIYKSLPEEESGYHAGDGAEGEGNLYGIGIEICLNKQPRGEKPSEAFIKAVKNASVLTAELMKKYDLPIEAVRQHNSFSGKNCPSCMRENDMWDGFIQDVLAHYNSIQDTIL